MPNTDKTQLVVIGAGPGGYVAAFHAADLGMEVTLVDAEEKPGGVCLLRGCIPSKALLHAAKVIHEAKEAADYGVSFGEPEIDLGKLRDWKRGVVDKLTGGIRQLAKARKVRYLKARAEFVDSSTLKLHRTDHPEGDLPETLEFEKCILASGSRSTMPGIFDIDDERVTASGPALDLPDRPESLLVIGGGYIGLEMGSVYAALGSKVTVVEMLDGILPGVDRDLVKFLEKRLKKQFEAIHLKTKVESLKPLKSGIKAKIKGEGIDEEITFDRVLVAVGRRPNTENLGLENTEVKVGRDGFVVVDESMRTGDPSIYAIGDVAGQPMLAHKASREGKVAVEAIAGENTVFDNVAIPAVVFTDPEIAWCGLMENEAKEQGREVKTAKFSWAASGRALTLGRPEGLTKIVFDPETERVLGVGITGYGAGDLIAEGVLAVEMAAVARDVADSIHPHPTLSETVMEAAEVFLGHATHVMG